MWCVGELNDEYLEKMEDILALYEKPYFAGEPVLCLDEKPVSLHQEVRSVLAAAPGQIAKRDSEYKRCGTANVFCSVEPKAGRHFTWPTPNRSAREFAKIIGALVRGYPLVQTIHLVMDNLNIHCRKSVTDYYGEQRGSSIWNRLTVHYTPKHGSWLNQAEIEIGLFSRQCLGTGRIPQLTLLRREARAWNCRTNRARTKINWQFTRAKARKKFDYTKNSFKRSKN
jgi:hypothetical protein